MAAPDKKFSLKLPELMLATCGASTLLALITAVFLEQVIFEKGLLLSEMLLFGLVFLIPPTAISLLVRIYRSMLSILLGRRIS